MSKKNKKEEVLADEITKDLKVIANDEITESDNVPEIKPSKKVKSNPDELTQDVIDKAISIAKNDDKVWDEITQEERWEYLKQARS